MFFGGALRKNDVGGQKEQELFQSSGGLLPIIYPLLCKLGTKLIEPPNRQPDGWIVVWCHPPICYRDSVNNKVNTKVNNHNNVNNKVNNKVNTKVNTRNGEKAPPLQQTENEPTTALVSLSVSNVMRPFSLRLRFRTLRPMWFHAPG
jgi:hypothetical protein